MTTDHSISKRLYRNPEDAFEARTTQIPFDESGCIYWIGGADKDGYGNINVNKRQVRAHRYAWERINGPIEGGLHCLHTCHRGHLGCVNVDHLYLGTHADNMRAKTGMKYKRKGRGADVTDYANILAVLTKVGVQIDVDRSGRQAGRIIVLEVDDMKGPQGYWPELWFDAEGNYVETRVGY